MASQFDIQGGVYTRNETMDGNPVDFSMAVVGSHVSGTDISSAVTLTKPTGATGILCQVLTQNARFRLDGVNPTASIGFQLAIGQLPIVIPVPGADIRFIQEAATASLQYQWVK